MMHISRILIFGCTFAVVLLTALFIHSLAYDSVWTVARLSRVPDPQSDTMLFVQSVRGYVRCGSLVVDKKTPITPGYICSVREGDENYSFSARLRWYGFFPALLRIDPPEGYGATLAVHYALLIGFFALLCLVTILLSKRYRKEDKSAEPDDKLNAA